MNNSKHRSEAPGLRAPSYSCCSIQETQVRTNPEKTLYSFPIAAVANNHLATYSNTNLSSYSSGGQKSKMSFPG